MKRLIAASLSLLLLGGCKATYWPEYGQGGAAERHPIAASAEGLRGELLGELSLVRDRREWLRQAGAEDCLPGQVVQAQHLENRIAREIDGGLLVDGQLNLQRQRDNLLVLERRLQFMTESGSCLPGALASDWDIAVDRGLDDPAQVAFERLRTRESGTIVDGRDSSVTGHIAQANQPYREHLEGESRRINGGLVRPADMTDVSDIVTTSEQIDIHRGLPQMLVIGETEFKRERY